MPRPESTHDLDRESKPRTRSRGDEGEEVANTTQLESYRNDHASRAVAMSEKQDALPMSERLERSRGPGRNLMHVSHDSGLHLRGGGGMNLARDGRSKSGGPKSPKIDKDPSTSKSSEGKTEEKKPSKGVTIAQGSPKIIDTQSPVYQYRERLARDLERRELAVRSPEKARVSPIREEASSKTSTPGSFGDDVATASTESNKTVRGGTTPGLNLGHVARTPSYPFPRMTTPGQGSSSLHRNLSSTSQRGILQSTGGQFENVVAYDQLRSDPSTPASTMTFQPPGTIDMPDNFDYPTPNLYELVLQLSAEPGLDAWWNSVVQILKDSYKAERVTLSVPADSTDLENVPWGQKATYNALEEDEYSMGYIGRNSGNQWSSLGDQSEPVSALEEPQRSDRLVRPSILSRHSFTSYEDRKASTMAEAPTESNSGRKRPDAMPRSRSYYPDTQTAEPTRLALNKEALEEHDAVEEEQQQQQPIPHWEAPLMTRREVKGRVLPVLQGLDLEADPLIDHNGVNRVVDRGNVIALTRNYPYLDSATDEKPSNFKAAALDESKKKHKKPLQNDSATKLSSLLGNATAPRASSRNRKILAGDKSKMASMTAVLDDAEPRPPTPRYEEYEQAPPSPWSQSPAPSPAIRAEPQENPFFTDAMVDESSFEPGPSPLNYSNLQAPQSIGIDNSWTVLHVPLKHILLSKSPQTFKLNSEALNKKGGARGKGGLTAQPEPSTPQSPSKDRQSPIAILSILTPVIPYPSNLRWSLENLAPHLATSFSLCRHYTNLETEVSGLHRKRPPTAGFGALGPDGRPLADPVLFSQLQYAPSEDPSLRSITGSITSPSDYSQLSRSAAGSPSGTPNWDPGSFGLVVERRSTGISPGQADDSYFSSSPRPANSEVGTPGFELRSKHAHTAAAEGSYRSNSGKSLRPDPPMIADSDTHDSSAVGSANTSDEVVPTIAVKRRSGSKESFFQSGRNDKAPSQNVDEPRRRGTGPISSTPSSKRHTMLHSYGGDFSSTFQSLPSGTELRTKPTALSQPESATTTTQVSMLPPTDRLKGLMLDTLPAHVFVALPVTGEIVWVNSRYLTYRGQTVADLVMDPWGSLHPEDRDAYLENWTKSLHTGEQFAHSVRLRRFDGAYRWHQARAVASKDKRGVIVQFIGSYMDIHDQKVAEVMAARQEEIEASEAKHRLLANLIPQIIFTATEDEGITFANQQWLSYTGQSFDDSLGVGFMDYVHPEDLAKCRIPTERSFARGSEASLAAASMKTSASATPTKAALPPDLSKPKSHPESLSRNDSSGSSSFGDLPGADLNELARKGIIKVATDSAGRISYTTELRLRSKTGEYRWHLIRCVEIDNIDFGNGESSYFGSATDINDHKLLEGKLKEAMESKGRFLSNMSHEIRTPLIGISGMVSFLQDTVLNEEQRDYSNTIQTSANSLLMIINDILDLSKVDAGMMKLNFEWFHARSLIEDVNELVSTMAIAKRLELNYIVEEDVPSWVKGDKVRIRQVLLNVIGNAIKFTAKGEVFSRCTVVKGDHHDNEIMLEFSIIDTGRGFSKDEAELIFKPFSQIDGSSTRQHGGSGLGLVISRQLVELHGGRMEGSAIPNEGSTFTFTARFGLPSENDYPPIAGTPPVGPVKRMPGESAFAPVMKPGLLQKAVEAPLVASPSSDVAVNSPAPGSSASSDPSVRSARTFNTSRSSASSINVAGLTHFSEAAKASGQELSQLRLEMPSGVPSPKTAPVAQDPRLTAQLEQFRPPMYSILIICPQNYSREATKRHIEMTLPKDVPHQITAMASVAEAQKLISGEEAVTFTHIVLNLGSSEEILSVVDQVVSTASGNTTVLVLSDSVHRQAVLKLAAETSHYELFKENKITFIYKPVKPSRFAAVFDPANSRDLSIDRNRSTAAQMVENQKQNYLDMEKRIGNKGYKVLLVEDNPVNQKVLVRYLKKVGIVAEIAADGVEGTETVFSHPHDYYSLILCDLHMPRKDGYQACREVRAWEKKNKYPALPIIALSANVMSDVQEKCVAAGFSDYVTKPVDFIDLSSAMSKFF